jgi:hypothetical protein
MIRSLSTSAFGQPSETKLTVGAPATVAEASSARGETRGGIKVVVMWLRT